MMEHVRGPTAPHTLVGRGRASANVRRSGGAPPGVRRRKAGTDQGNTVTDRGRGNSGRISASERRGGVPREARKRCAPPRPPLFVAECFDRVQPRRLLGGIQPEEET